MKRFASFLLCMSLYFVFGAAALAFSVAPTPEERDFTHSVEMRDGAYSFRYSGQESVEYLVWPYPSRLAQVEVRIDGQSYLAVPSPALRLMLAGQRYSLNDCQIALLNRELMGGVLSLRYRLTVANQLINLTLVFQLTGKSLKIGITSPQAVFTEVDMGLGNIGTEISVPYLTWVRVAMLNGKFICGFFDWTVTNSSLGGSWVAPTGAKVVYRTRTDGTLPPLSECFYLTCSSNIREVWPTIPNPPSPYLHDLAGRVVIDAWNVGRFRNLTRYLQILKEYGCERLAVILHVWQRLGYDNGYPAVLPANALLGGEEELKELGRVTADLGYRFALHENYQDYYQNTLDYSPGALAVDSAGNPIKNWYNPTTQLYGYFTKPYCAQKHARKYSPQIHDRYRTSAAYHDGEITARDPRAMNYQSTDRDPGGASSRAIFEYGQWLLEFLRKTHQGPVFGEGGGHAIWAGLVDGCEAQVEGGEEAQLLVDFDLLKVHPLAANHGMGYYGRWGELVPREQKLDKYRAMEIAFGHAGFYMASLRNDLTSFLREYHIMAPLHERLALAQPERIRYWYQGEWYDVSEALRAGIPLNRVETVYKNGLTTRVNLGADDWLIDGKRLGSGGFSATGAGLTAYTARIGSTPADYVEADGVIYADARTYSASLPEDLSTQIEVCPKLGGVRYTGGRTFQITYNWEVKERIPAGSKIFVHFVDRSLQGGEQIAFGNDHTPALSIEEWPVGQTISDGPWTVTVPANCLPGIYEILVGIYRPGEGRLALKGKDAGGSRYIIGRLLVAGTETDITNITALPSPYLDLSPQLIRGEYLGGRTISLTCNWHINEGVDLPEGYQVFLYGIERRLVEGERIAFSLERPADFLKGRSRGEIFTEEPWVISLPEGCGPGEYEIVMGISGPGGRLGLTGQDAGEQRYLIGRIVVSGNGTEITDITVEPNPFWGFTKGLASFWEIVDFGKIATNGALRLETRPTEILVMPYPRQALLKVVLKLDQLYPENARKVKRIYGITKEGRICGELTWQQTGETLSFLTDVPESWFYRVELLP